MRKALDYSMHPVTYIEIYYTHLHTHCISTVYIHTHTQVLHVTVYPVIKFIIPVETLLGGYTDTRVVETGLIAVQNLCQQCPSGSQVRMYTFTAFVMLLSLKVYRSTCRIK